MAKVAGDIDAVERKIDAVEGALNQQGAQDGEQAGYLGMTKQELKDHLKALMREKEQLRDKEAKLMDRQAMRPPDAPAMEAKVDQLAAQNQEILEAVKAKQEKEYSFSGAATGKPEAVAAMMTSFDLTSIAAGETPTSWPPGVARKKYTLHTWVSDPPDEPRETPTLLSHFRSQLQHFGVPLDVPQGFVVRDVRGQHKLSFRTELATGLVAFNGGTDAVVVPYRVVSWNMQARVIVHFKTPVSLDKPDACELQAVLELFGALHWSQYPPLVVFTDCINFVIYQAHGRAVLRWHTFEPDEAGWVSTDVAMRLIAAFLLRCSPDPAFSIQNAATSSALSQDAAVLIRSVKRKLDDGGELATQLGIVAELPEDERVAVTHDILNGWARHSFYYI
ncbi:hypothetical protein JKP88DRAFT_265713 [Tribonema minus]|uniref:Uncharacterized protein n=1 Tax=Tribonema minus TaxID=303371 RepID=A0A836C8I1_9STRA|nr:hypothetical protein JKP88DRAFT_265713 [Tribonema minus]